MRTIRTTMARIIIVLAVAGLMVETLHAQCTPANRRARLMVANAGTGRDTIWFGFSPSATYGVDVSLCESEYPPFPPSEVFEARWMDIPNHTGLGEGVKQDYRHYFTAATVDTHQIKFQPGIEGGPMKFKWVRSEVQAICDSAVIMDIFGGVVVPRTRMTSSDSILVSAPINLYIVRYGQRLTGVNQIPNLVPNAFGLDQNYPNPFNPTTTMRFAVPRSAVTDISVYDVLGRKVTTLVQEPMSPGYYETTWNGKNGTGADASSGVYFVRMNAQTDNGMNFSAIRKLLLMK